MGEPSSAAAALDIVGLSKSYRVGHLRPTLRPALHDLTLQVASGEVFGYLGPNGSGKTTTLKLLMGLLYPDAGHARVLGIPFEQRAWRYRVGYLPENPYFYDHLTAEEYLLYAGELFGLSRAARRERGPAVLGLRGLRRSAALSLRRFSQGMARRGGVAQAPVHEPQPLHPD